MHAVTFSNPQKHSTDIHTHTHNAHTPQEEYLSDEEFESIFGVDKAAFAVMPAWKRINAKKAKALF